MARRPLLVIGLDGYDPGIARRLVAEGRLPHLARLESAGRCFTLVHGIEKYTGLAWEQFSTGRTPEAACRWSEVTIDTRAYAAHQHLTCLAPFTDGLDARTVVFDVPYFNLPVARGAQGMVSWGAHDPGVPRTSVPAGIADEVLARFGPYPAEAFVYGFVWPDPERTREMGRCLVEGVRARARVARWLLGERLPGWDLGLVVLGEYHSAVEALWHGWDEDHPLARHPSAAPARAGLVAVYEESDRALGELWQAFPQADLLVFTAHGMGRNLGDVPAMLLVPELLYRHFTGRVGFTPDPAWQADGTDGGSLCGVEHWSAAVNERVAIPPPRPSWWPGRRAPVPTRLDWMPATRYASAWPRMRAYAEPAYYDARVRVNLKGREARGRVRPADYFATLDEVEGLLRECVDPRTGRPLAIEVDRRSEGDPRRRDDSDADLVVRFGADHYAFHHPRLGTIGPAPCRRTGGHTGGPGVGYFVSGAGGAGGAGDLGRFRTLDVPHAVRALVAGNGGASPLGAALLAARGAT